MAFILLKNTLKLNIMNYLKLLILICFILVGHVNAQSPQSITVKLSTLKRAVPKIGYNLSSHTKPSWNNVRFRDSTQKLGIDLLRYPGGIESQYFDWKTGKILPFAQWQNGTLNDFSQLSTTPHLPHTLAQLKSFTDYAKIKPIFCLNVLTSSLSEQLAMLRQAQVLGFAIEYIELGHELYGAERDFSNAFATPNLYALEMKRWTDSLRINFPKAKIAAIAATKDPLTPQGNPMPERIRLWNDALNAANLNVQAYSLHHFFRHNTGQFNPSFFQAINSSFTEWTRFKKFALDSIPKSREIWITEYNIDDPFTSNTYAIASSWTHGLYLANILNQMLEVPQITMMLNNQVAGLPPFAALASNTTFGDTITNDLTASGNVLRLFHQSMMGKDSAQQLEFDPGITAFIGQIESKLLNGWLFSNAKDTALTLLNMSNQTIELNLAALLPRGFSFEQLTSASFLGKNVVTTNLNRVTGTGQQKLRIQPYSVVAIQSPAIQTPPPPKLEISVFRNIPYHQAIGVDQNLLSLDIHLPTGIKTKKPVIIYVHGGNWNSGDKANINSKDKFFADLGFVLVSVNYRLSPNPVDTSSLSRVKFHTHPEDLARAIAWVYQNIEQYGGDPEKIALMGFEAGAHLVSLVSTDASYLEKLNLGLNKIKCTCALDADGFDIPYYLDKYVIPNNQNNRFSAYVNAFSSSRNEWLRASPLTYVAARRKIPDFMVVNQVTPERIDLATRFVNALAAANVGWGQVYFNSPNGEMDLTLGMDAPSVAIYNQIVTNFYLGCLNKVISNTTFVRGQERLVLYPNPTTGLFYLNLGEDHFTIYLHNQAGQLQKSFIDQTGILEIDATNLPKGIYFVQAVNGEKIQTGKIIVQ